MPLSEHEQRMLEQMERALYAEDPKFASALRGADLRRHLRRRLYQSLAVFIVGVSLLMAGLMINELLSVLGFLLMLAGALFAVTSWRRISAPGEASTEPAAGRSKPRRAGFMERMEERWRRRRGEQED